MKALNMGNRCIISSIDHRDGIWPKVPSKDGANAALALVVPAHVFRRLCALVVCATARTRTPPFGAQKTFVIEELNVSVCG